MSKAGKRPGLKDVAALAGTSIATASRALSGTGYVAPETRTRVLEAAQQVNYQPDLRARSLRQRTTHSIGLIVPNLLNAYFTAWADAIVQLLAAKGYHLLLSSTQDDPEIENAIVRDMVGQVVDGLIWVPTSPRQELLDHIVRLRIPAVAILRRVPADVLDTVVFEDYAGSTAATHHLLDLGHQRIGYIGGGIQFSSNQDRWQAFLAAMGKANLPTDLAIVREGPLTSSWGFLATGDMLRRPSPPTAVFVGSNAFMPGVMRALRQHDIEIPREISLVCFDDIDWFSFSTPPITSVKIGHRLLAETAIDVLMSRIKEEGDEESPPRFVETHYELVVRGSTAPPRSHELRLRGDLLRVTADDG